MRFLSALALVAVATLAAAQNGTTSAPATTSAPTANCYHSYSYSCINDPACNWCFSYSASTYSIDYGSGNCYAKTTPCGGATTGSTYNMTLSNPCVSMTTQTGCTGNPACGWCAASSKCFYVGLTSSSGSSVTSADTLLCAGVSMVRKATCSTAASSREECVNLPYTCYWCNSACSSTYCSNIYDTVSCSWSTQRSCTTYESTTYINNGGACGWCSNYYGTNLSQCLFYTSGVPSSCSTSSNFAYNTYFGGGAAALALAVGLVGAVLIIVIVIPLVCVACIIGCSVYFCCIRPNRQTTVVVQAGGNQPYVPMNQPGKI